MATLAVPSAVNVTMNQGLWTTPRTLRAVCLVSSATLFLTSMACSMKLTDDPKKLEKLPYVNKIIEFVAKSIVERPEQCALVVGSLAIAPEILKITRGVLKGLKYCFYDQPIIGASIGSSVVSIAATVYKSQILEYFKPTEIKKPV
jgi:hypothetical protein